MRRIAEAVLTALADAPQATIEQLAAVTGLSHKQISDACALLHRRKFIIRRSRPGWYQATDAGRELVAARGAIKSGPQGPTGHPPRNRTLRRRLWQALTMVHKATLPELLSLACAGNEKNANNNARKYLIALERAGYLAKMGIRSPGSSPTSNGFARWVLVKETGARPPVYNSRKRLVFDPNTQEEVRI